MTISKQISRKEINFEVKANDSSDMEDTIEKISFDYFYVLPS